MKTIKPRASLTVENFIVEVPHVRVTLNIRRVAGDVLARQAEYIQSRYGSDVLGMCLPAIFGIRAGGKGQCLADARFLVGIHGSIHGFKTSTVTLDFEVGDWETVQQLARYLGEPTEAVIRAMLFARSAVLKRVERERMAGAEKRATPGR